MLLQEKFCPEDQCRDAWDVFSSSMTALLAITTFSCFICHYLPVPTLTVPSFTISSLTIPSLAVPSPSPHSLSAHLGSPHSRCLRSLSSHSLSTPLLISLLPDPSHPIPLLTVTSPPPQEVSFMFVLGLHAWGLANGPVFPSGLCDQPCQMPSCHLSP